MNVFFFRLELLQAAEEKVLDLDEKAERQNTMLQEKEDLINACEVPSPEEKSAEEFKKMIEKKEVGF